MSCTPEVVQLVPGWSPEGSMDAGEHWLLKLIAARSINAIYAQMVKLVDTQP